jgi:predicted MFS family arabinose efflux permease
MRPRTQRTCQAHAPAGHVRTRAKCRVDQQPVLKSRDRRPALAGLAIVGIGWSCIIGTTIAVLQSAEPRMLGRVMSLFALVLLGGMSAGAPIASFISASFGPRAPFLAGTAAAIAAVAVVASSSGRRSRALPVQHDREGAEVRREIAVPARCPRAQVSEPAA